MLNFDFQTTATIIIFFSVILLIAFDVIDMLTLKSQRLSGFGTESDSHYSVIHFSFWQPGLFLP